MISSREVYRNPWTSVREDVIERSNGQRGIYGVVDKDPACIVIPIERAADGEFLWLGGGVRSTGGGAAGPVPGGGDVLRAAAGRVGAAGRGAGGDGSG